MDLQRMILFFALAFVTMSLWTKWEQFSNPQAPVQTQVEQGGDTLPSSVPSAPAADASAGASTAGGTSAVPIAPAKNGEVAADSKRVTVETDMFTAAIDTVSGDIVSVKLKKHAKNSKELETPFALIKNEFVDSELDLFVSQTGLLGTGGAAKSAPNHTNTYTAAQDSYRVGEGDSPVKVPLTYTAEGVEYTKTLTFTPGAYHVLVDYTVNNTSAEPWSGHLYAQFLRTSLSDDGGLGLMTGAPSFKGGAIYTPEEKYEKISFDDIEDDVLTRRADAGWVAMLQHYFVGAYIPNAGQPFEIYSKFIRDTAPVRYSIGYKSAVPTVVEPGSTGTLGTRLFVGPKERKFLDEQAEGLRLTVDYGWLTPISEPLFWVLNKIHSVVGNWGWAIIFLTLLIKLVFFPLSAASYKSMARMKKMQPRLATLKERYGDDRAKLNQEMMDLYKTEKINPLGGCLPILIQIPVFIALYWVLLESVELRQAPWMLWIKDLSVKDAYFVLPILMGASMIAQQFLNPAPLDPIQKNIMMALPVVFTFLFLFFPAGLVLYWLVNNCLSIGQQWYITRKIV